MLPNLTRDAGNLRAARAQPWKAKCGRRLFSAPDDARASRLLQNEADERLGEFVQIRRLAMHRPDYDLALVRHLLTPPVAGVCQVGARHLPEDDRTGHLLQLFQIMQMEALEVGHDRTAHS